MADLVVGRAVWLGSGAPQRPKGYVDGRGRVECPKCGSWWIEFMRDPSVAQKCRACGADCSDNSDQWPDEVE